jgi:hypothetical protein
VAGENDNDDNDSNNECTSTINFLIPHFQIVFLIATAVYTICATFYNIFGQGTRQPWDDPSNDVVHYYSQNQNEETDTMLRKKQTVKNDEALK